MVIMLLTLYHDMRKTLTNEEYRALDEHEYVSSILTYVFLLFLIFSHLNALQYNSLLSFTLFSCL